MFLPAFGNPSDKVRMDLLFFPDKEFPFPGKMTVDTHYRMSKVIFVYQIVLVIYAN